MKLKILLSVVFTITCVLVFGQNKIQGYILDKQTGERLPYVTIGALHQQYGCYTDTTGLFTLYFLNEGDSLKILYLGYRSLYTTVHDLRNNAKILLEVNPMHLKEILVTPSKKRPKVMGIGFFTKNRNALLSPSSYPMNIQAIFIPFPEKGNNVFVKSIKFTCDVTYKYYPLRVNVV